jgi:predicted N-acyltransferase
MTAIPFTPTTTKKILTAEGTAELERVSFVARCRVTAIRAGASSAQRA